MPKKLDIYMLLSALGDQTIAETIANVLTSLPFIFLGFQAPRQALSLSTRPPPSLPSYPSSSLLAFFAVLPDKLLIDNAGRI